MTKLHIDKDESEFLNTAIEQWEADGLIDGQLAERLKNSYNVKQFDWKKLSQYSFWTALTCGIIAICSLIFDKTILSLLENLYYTPNILVSLISAALAVFCYYWGQKNKKRHPERILSNEATIIAGTVFTAISVGFLGRSIDRGTGNFPLLILSCSAIYFFLAYRFNSKLIWAIGMISSTIWFGAETGYLSDFSYHFLGMNYPLRYVLWGVLLTATSFLLQKFPSLVHFRKTSYIIALLTFFTSLWLLSIFGNYEDMDQWAKIRQFSLFYWAVLSTLLSLLTMLYGLKYEDVVAREFGISFLIINLYTRYFEYFWDITDKALFFSILAVSFWLIGRKAEKIWNLKI